MTDSQEQKLTIDKDIGVSSDLKEHLENKIREYIEPYSEKVDRTHKLLLQKIRHINVLEVRVESLMEGKRARRVEDQPRRPIEDALTDDELEQKFKQLVRTWKEETVNLSSIQKISMNNTYLQIIGLGPVAIRLILNELKQAPDFWFCALRALTRTNPVPPEMSGDLHGMTKVWIDWGRKHGYL